MPCSLKDSIIFQCNLLPPYELLVLHIVRWRPTLNAESLAVNRRGFSVRGAAVVNFCIRKHDFDFSGIPACKLNIS